nr:histidine phosphatase family protein [Streptomyces sp. IBTA2]
MTTTATRYLHLVRHGEATPDETGLTGNGRRQAALLGHRLRACRSRPSTTARSPGAEETARLIHAELADGIPLHRTESAGDYVPHFPAQGRTPAGIGRLLPPLPRRHHPRGAGAGRRPGPPGTGPVHRPGRG